MIEYSEVVIRVKRVFEYVFDIDFEDLDENVTMEDMRINKLFIGDLEMYLQDEFKIRNYINKCFDTTSTINDIASSVIEILKNENVDNDNNELDSYEDPNGSNFIIFIVFSIILFMILILMLLFKF